MTVVGMTAALLAGCAQPGQLGYPVPPPAPPPAPAAPPVVTPPPPPSLSTSGRLDDPVALRTRGPAVFSVRTENLEPGASTGWYRRPGTEMSIVRSGSVTLLSADSCDGTRYAVGDALFVPDARPHLVRNDGTVPAEIVVTSLLAPGEPDRQDVPSRC